MSRKRQRIPRTTPRREQTERSEVFSDKLLGESEDSQPTESKDDTEALKDFWSIHRHHIELRVQLYVPKEETFPVPLKYMDVSRSTHTNVDVMQVECLLWYGTIAAPATSGYRALTALCDVPDETVKAIVDCQVLVIFLATVTTASSDIAQEPPGPRVTMVLSGK